MNVGDTFIAPTGPFARFPEREMRVIAVSVADEYWIDAVPVRPVPTDLYWHSTYELGADGRPLPVYPGGGAWACWADEGGAS
jgi:hypothetical protein